MLARFLAAALPVLLPAGQVSGQFSTGFGNGLTSGDGKPRGNTARKFYADVVDARLYLGGGITSSG